MIINYVASDLLEKNAKFDIQKEKHFDKNVSNIAKENLEKQEESFIEKQLSSFKNEKRIEKSSVKKPDENKSVLKLFDKFQEKI